MRTELRDPTVVNDQDLVGISQGGQTVGDGEGGSVVGHLVDGVLDELFGLGVQGCCGFVQNEDGGVVDEGAGDGDTLAFTAREGVALLAYDGVVALGEPHDEIVGVGGTSGADDLGVGGVGLGVLDVVPDGA